MKTYSKAHLLLLLGLFLVFPNLSFAESISGVVVIKNSGCDYFLVEDDHGDYNLLEWYGDHDPDRGDTLVGAFDGYGFKDFYDTSVSGKVHVWQDDWLLSKSRAIEKYADKCPDVVSDVLSNSFLPPSPVILPATLPTIPIPVVLPPPNITPTPALPKPPSSFDDVNRVRQEYGLAPVSTNTAFPQDANKLRGADLANYFQSLKSNTPTSTHESFLDKIYKIIRSLFSW